MIALALLLAPVPVASPLMADDEVVVTARRAREFRYRIGFDRKSRQLVCKVLKSTKDKPLDALLCETARSCVPTGIDPNSQPTEAQLTLIRACLNTGEKAAIARRAAELRAARTQS